MYEYSKHILSIEQQLQTYKDSGMILPSEDEAKAALETIGYYRLRGYCYRSYDNQTKKYKAGTCFSNVLKLYSFDVALSELLFSMLGLIEVSLRCHLKEALLLKQDPFILNDPSICKGKSNYWKNYSSIVSEISRSSEPFIKHHYDHYEGAIPVWVVVEVMSYGTLSKVIKNLKTGFDTPASKLVKYYTIPSPSGNDVYPSFEMFCSWIHSTSLLRNACAHNGRIYDRTFTTPPELPKIDAITQEYSKSLYAVILSMKHLCPSIQNWNDFRDKLFSLIDKYHDVISLEDMHFPVDWKKHI